MLKIYGLANCDSCRKARNFLAEHDIAHEFHDVREEGLNIQMLERWGDRVDWQKLVNRQSTTWRDLPEAARTNLTRPQAMALLLQHPTLLKRPVFDHRNYFAVGFSESRFSEFLKRLA